SVERLVDGAIGRCQPVKAGGEPEIVRRRKVVVQQRLMAGVADARAGIDRVPGIGASDPDRAAMRSQQADAEARPRGLAGTVRSEDELDPAGQDGERDAVHSDTSRESAGDL